MSDIRPTETIDPTKPGAEQHRAEELIELRRIRSALGLLSFMAAAIACYFARDMILPLILGIMLALTLSPVVRVLGRRGIPPPVSAIALIFTLAVGLVAGAYVMSGPVSVWLQDAPELGDRLQERMRGIFASVQEVQEASEQVEQITDPAGEGDVQRVQLEQPGLLTSAVSSVATAGTTLAVALVMALFVLASGEMFTVKLIESLPRMSEKKRAVKIVHGVERAISRYLLTITLINAGLGLVIWGLMWAIGLPDAYIWGVVAFAFNFLPYIGATAGVFLVAGYSLLSFEQVGYAFVAPALYLGATSLEGQLITPTILGRRLELNTVSVFVTVVFWAWLWGIPGALMAVPFLVIVKVVSDHIPALETLSKFLGASSIRVHVEPDETETEAG